MHIPYQSKNAASLILPLSLQVYELFDQLCLLSKGSVIYFGAAAAAGASFSAAGLPCPSNRNPADHFLHWWVYSPSIQMAQLVLVS